MHLRKIFTILLIFSTIIFAQTWTQVGADIDGEAAGDWGGWPVSISSDGSRVVVGGLYNDGTVTDAGHARIYSESGGVWTQVGGDIDGEATGDYSGYGVSLSSDGMSVAISAPQNDGVGTDAGHARIYGLSVMNLKQEVTNIPDGGSYNYNNQALGSFTDVIFTIENKGRGVLTLTTPIAHTGADISQFSIVTQPSSVVSPSGGITTFIVRFIPDSIGDKTATISIANDGAANEPYDLTLNGTGATAEMHIKQSTTDIADGGSHDYGTKTLGTDTDVIFTIENNGGSDLILITPITIGGANAGQFSIPSQPTSVIAGSSSTTFTVRFSPTSVGIKTAIISIPNNDSDENPYNLTLNGTGAVGYVQISGYIKDAGNNPIEGVAVDFSNGGVTTTTDINGYYRRSITNGWSGTATPSKTDYSFAPVSITYSNIITNQYNQDYVGADLTLAVNEHLGSLPTEFTVLPAYPNPFNPSTTISYGIANGSSGRNLSVQIDI